MPRKIELLSEAQVDLWDAVEYYEGQVSGLGLDFEQEVRSALRIIQQNPEMWPKRSRDVRRGGEDQLLQYFNSRLSVTVGAGI